MDRDFFLGWHLTESFIITNQSLHFTLKTALKGLCDEDIAIGQFCAEVIT